MKHLLGAASLLLLCATTTHAADQPAPLKALCDRICGGVWAPDIPPAPDQFVTTFSYAWDEPLGLIRGTASTTGGVAGIHRETIILFGFDDATQTIWTFRASGEGRTVYGTTELGDDGYRDTVEVLKADMPGRMISTHVFKGADEYTETNEILSSGSSTLGTPETYKRVQR